MVRVPSSPHPPIVRATSWRGRVVVPIPSTRLGRDLGPHRLKSGDPGGPLGCEGEPWVPWPSCSSRWLGDHGIPMVTNHSRGHAHIPDLVRLAEAVSPERIIAIDSAAGNGFGDFLSRVERGQDHEPWKI